MLNNTFIRTIFFYSPLFLNVSLLLKNRWKSRNFEHLKYQSFKIFCDREMSMRRKDEACSSTAKSK